MYSDRHLDSPPPRSQFHRPWSPEPYDPQPSSSNAQNITRNANYHNHRQEEEPSFSYAIPSVPPRQRREASDVSVEALDLADYAKTLRARQAEDPYPPFPSQFQGQSASTFPQYPPPASSRDSLAMHPPSLVSRGATTSSNTTNLSSRTHLSNVAPQSNSSYPSRGRPPGRRPFSLPATPSHSANGHVSRGHPPSSYPHRGPQIADPDEYLAPSQEIDISNFPKWSRGWYPNHNNSSAARQHAFGANDMDPVGDMYTPLPPSNLDPYNSKGKSIFDPEYNYDPYTNDLYDPPPPLSSIGHESSRNLLPWSNDPPEYGTPVDSQVKAERLRMLEREFGSQAKSKSSANNSKLLDPDGKPLVGTVDEKGNLVTAGPKRRTAARMLQIVFALGACIPGIYAAIAIKPSDPRFPPPPANKPAAFVLYVVSSITTVLLLYLFLIRPCCCGRSKSKSSKHPLSVAANMGMMVLPVGGHNGKKKQKGGKKGKNKNAGQGDVQVNLIVDPSAFQLPEASDDDDDDEDGYDSNEHDSNVPGGYNTKKKRRNNKARKRRGLFEGLAMEESWKRARSWAKKLAFVDVIGGIVWGAVFVFIMIGKRCPTGDFDGWCNAYNVSTACSCLLCVAFGFSIFFDVQDLHASKQSPRTRS